MAVADLDDLMRPGGVVPVNIETTAALVRQVLRLRAALMEIAGGDAYYDGAVKFMAIARDALSADGGS